MNKPIILADRHHEELYRSLGLFFEKRMGGTLLTPIGLEWFPEWWKIAEPYGNDPRTATQYLGLRGKEPDVDGIVDMGDYKGITFEAFKHTPVDIIIASIPQHIPVYKKLMLCYQPQAKLIVQMGNMFHEIMNNLHEIPNLMSSSIELPVPGNCNAVFYHQEFDTEIFKPDNSTPENKVTSFLHLLPRTNHGHYYYELREAMPTWDFKSYGSGCEDGAIREREGIADEIRRSAWGWHCKWGGDGYGHALYNWYACGRPIITVIDDYKDKLGGELLTDEETCIDMGKHSVAEVADKIMHCPEEKYNYYCQQAYNRFKSCVDFDEEFKKLQTFIERLRQ